MSHPAFCVTSDKWYSHILGHFISVHICHYFAFLWRPLLLLPSNWLSSVTYGKIYSVIVQCNSGPFYILFVWVIILPKPKLKMYLREKINRRRKTLTPDLKYCFVYLNWIGERHIMGIIIKSLKQIHIIRYTVLTSRKSLWFIC